MAAFLVKAVSTDTSESGSTLPEGASCTVRRDASVGIVENSTTSSLLSSENRNAL